MNIIAQKSPFWHHVFWGYLWPNILAAARFIKPVVKEANRIGTFSKPKTSWKRPEIGPRLHSDELSTEWQETWECHQIASWSWNTGSCCMYTRTGRGEHSDKCTWTPSPEKKCGKGILFQSQEAFCLENKKYKGFFFQSGQKNLAAWQNHINIGLCHR